MIEFKNISFGYKNEKNIFDNFSFLVREQERWGILGFNGAGKINVDKNDVGDHQTSGRKNSNRKQ